MNRRELLKGLLALPAAGLLGGCQHRFTNYSFLPKAPANKLAVVLHGPWAVVVRRNKHNRVNAFVPKIYQSELEKSHFQHEFRFQSPLDPACPYESGYRFELLHHGLNIAGRSPQIDRGFNDVLFSVPDWTPDWDDYFVGLELPAPDAINYIPPLYPLLFDLDPGEPAGKLGSAPLNHVLEYSVSDADDVRLLPIPSEQCRNKEEKNHQGYPPLRSRELQDAYNKLYRYPDQAADPNSQVPFIVQGLEHYSRVFFLGVGVPPESPMSQHMREREEHGKWFFNEKLLPAIFQHGQPPPRGAKIKKIGRDALPCGPGEPASSSPTLMSAVWRPAAQRPHLQYVVSNQNCSGPGLTVQ